MSGSLPWTAAIFRRDDGGFGVVLRLDLSFASEQAAQDVGRYFCALVDVRLGEGVGRRLLEAAEDEAPEPAAGPLPLFQAPA